MAADISRRWTFLAFEHGQTQYSTSACPCYTSVDNVFVSGDKFLPTNPGTTYLRRTHCGIFCTFPLAYRTPHLPTQCFFLWFFLSQASLALVLGLLPGLHVVGFPARASLGSTQPCAPMDTSALLLGQGHEQAFTFLRMAFGFFDAHAPT